MTDTIRPSASEVTTNKIPGAKQSEKLAIPAAPRPGLFTGEPTPDQLAAEEELIREDLAAFEKEVLGVVSAENTNSTPSNGGKEKKVPVSLRSVPRIASSHAKPAKARAKKLNGKKTAAKGGPKKTLPQRRQPEEEGNVTQLNWASIFEAAKKQLIENKIPFIGGERFGLEPCTPISNREVCQKLKNLETVDAYAVARILLTWKGQHRFSEQQVTSILVLIRDGRKASIPHILEAIDANPTDARMTNAEQTPDLITQGTRDMAADVFDSNSDQTVRAPSTLKRTGRRKPLIEED
jgi:hypothetical protein